MNPLSPITYYRRHKRSALLQVALISLATVGMFILVAVLDTVPQRANVSYLTKVSRVFPTGGELDPTVVSQIQTHPDVARTVPDNGLRIGLPTLFGTDSQRLLGVSPEDAQYLMPSFGVRIKEGRMFAPRTNEIMLSEEVVRALGLELGDEISRERNQTFYGVISAPLALVGILESDPSTNSGPSVHVGFVSAEYLNSHEAYAPRMTSLLVVPSAAREAAVEDFLTTSISSKYTEVETFSLLAGFLEQARVGVYVIFGVVNSVVSVVMALTVGIINRIAITQRLPEFGLLHALGRPKKQLIRRLTLETAIVTGIGWLAGLGLALLALSSLKNGLFYDMGMEMNLFNPAPFFFVLPIPIIVIILIFLSVRRIFAQLDAVSIVEQGKLSQEPAGQARPGRARTPRTSASPLSSVTFYMRHRRRGVLLIIGTALMVLSITFPVFLLSAMMNAIEPSMEYLQSVSVLAPVRAELDPGVVGQVKSHPAVARTVPAIELDMIMTLPPGGAVDVNIFGVSETDLPALMETFGVHVQEGRLPQPRSNEIVLSAGVATNRGLHVGDVIGGETDDEAMIADDVPTEMVIVGILSPDRPWIGFASSEYLQSHALTASRSPRLLVIPHEGQKQTLDTWLAGADAAHPADGQQPGIDPAQTRTTIHSVEMQEYREMTTSAVLTFALLECMIAAIAAVALATLNYIFFAQRKEEFGILNAIGRARRWLVWRTMKETSSVIGIAWVVGAALCGVGLLLMQSLVYAPRGLTLDFFSPTPWLLTLPIPLAVVVASAVTIAWTLSRLDPVSIVERR